MNIKNKKIIIFACIIIVAIVLFLFMMPKKIRIGFFGLTENEITKIKEEINSISTFDKLQKDYTIFETNLPEKNVKKMHLLFSTGGKAVHDINKTFQKIDDKAITIFSESLKNNVVFNDMHKYTIPITLQPFEIVVKKDIFNSDKILINNLQAMEEKMLFAKDFIRYPVSIIGADNNTLFLLISSIMALSDYQIDSSFDGLKQDINLSNNCPISLKNALDTLVSWRKKEFLYPTWFQLSEFDVKNLMEFNMSAISFLTIDQHNRIGKNILDNFTPFMFPLSNGAQNRNITCRKIYISKAKKSNGKLQQEINHIFTFFSNADGQTIIANNLNLSPANSRSSTDSSHSLIGRYWITSSNGTLPTIDNILYSNNNDKNIFANEIRKYLEVDGIGY